MSCRCQGSLAMPSDHATQAPLFEMLTVSHIAVESVHPVRHINAGSCAQHDLHHTATTTTTPRDVCPVRYHPKPHTALSCQRGHLKSKLLYPESLVLCHTRHPPCVGPPAAHREVQREDADSLGNEDAYGLLGVPGRGGSRGQGAWGV